MLPVRFLSLVLTAGLLATPAQADDETYLFQHENTLGTLLELRIRADSQPAAERAETLALAEIDRLARIFSTYDPQSEFSRWQTAAVAPTTISRELREVLQASDRWRRATGGAFHPGAELLSTIWRRAGERGVLPSDPELHAAVVALRTPPWELHGETSAARRIGRYPLSLNAIAKGYIIDRVCERILGAADVSGALVKIGGDLRVAGRLQVESAVRDPRDQSEAPATLGGVRLRNQALATSGGYFRGVDVAGRRYSHILDPRSGRPVEATLSVSVVADSAMTADALATACSVLGPAESLALIEQIDDAACLLIDAEGRSHASRAWSALAAGAEQFAFFQAEDAAKSAKPAAGGKTDRVWNGGFELQIEFEIQPGDGGRYRRPYVAVWIEDEQGFPVRTLALWVQTGGPGPRWIPDLRRWYRSDRVRRLADGTDLIKTVAEATRKPGVYQLIWDGADDQERLVKPGKYTVSLEAVREHGTYQLIRKDVTLADKPFSLKLPGNAEIKAAALEYRQRPPARPAP